MSTSSSNPFFRINALLASQVASDLVDSFTSTITSCQTANANGTGYTVNTTCLQPLITLTAVQNTLTTRATNATQGISGFLFNIQPGSPNYTTISNSINNLAQQIATAITQTCIPQVIQQPMIQLSL